ncbi:PadR family transcriptional regulator [Paenibacillus sp. Y412MC10]|uniref:PadR family transcriptional regulator n=1 Tax=Geobacillus sp. (strain Y412MC10) TaxID=481743 RepID=UPI00119EA223|nr:PadR family transcriptional regulator [Paenibacillus sp. Y412MC10]
MTMVTNIKKSPVALAILCFLIEEPMHPYRMQQLIDEVINVRHRASIYQTIERLHRDKAIAIQGKKKNEGRPDLVVYEITDLGHEAAYTWIREMISTPAQEFLEFPAAVSFLALLTPEDVALLFKQRVNALENTLARLKDQFQKGVTLRLPRLFLLESEYQQAVLEAEIGWIQSVIVDIEARSLTWSMEELRKRNESIDNRLDEKEIE